MRKMVVNFIVQRRRERERDINGEGLAVILSSRNSSKPIKISTVTIKMVLCPGAVSTPNNLHTYHSYLMLMCTNVVDFDFTQRV